MRIAIDIRPLIQDRGGVALYTREIVRALCARRDGNEYILYSTGSQKPQLIGIDVGQHVQVVHISIPNKILNAGIFWAGRPTVNELIRRQIGQSIDLFFAPNVDFFAVDPETPVIMTLHDLSFEFYPQYFSQKSMLWHRLLDIKRKAHRAAHLIAVSESTRQDAIHHYAIPEDKISAIHLGCDLSEGDLKWQDNGISEKYIIAVSLHDERKNIQFCIDAFCRARRTVPELSDVHLVLAGIPRSAISRNVAKLKKEVIEKYVHIVPYCSRTGLMKLIAGAQACLYTSVYEGFGLPPLEAAQFGIPLIIAANSSLGEVYGPNAFFVDPYDEASLIHALRSVVGNSVLHERYSLAARNISSHYVWDRAADATRAIFAKCV